MTDTIEQQLRDGLARLRDAGPAQPFDPADDLARGHVARRRARSRSLAGVATSVTAVAVACALWVHGASGPAPHPVGSSSHSATLSDTTAPTPSSTASRPSYSTAPPMTTGQLGRRMVEVVRARAAGADRYLGGWGDDSSGGGIRTSFDSFGVGRFAISVAWGRPGSSSLGGVSVGATTAPFAREDGQAASLRCGGAFTDTTTSPCRLADGRPDGPRLYYGSTGTTRAASLTRPDGRVAYVVVTARQAGNSLTATTAPLPSKSELIAIVTDPRLLWDGALVDSSPFGSSGGTWLNAPSTTSR
ncbi:hypothetical protein [Intrasporangium sp. YIM S08009]|uniref:hypothetical protein n=1 Tax=Intrasporangium zincisolvens TaxID=3080018 RepID=UPI002B05F203|nr:hypothetical protein [Intrasporangium sp. YIM S08009]